MEYEKSIYGLNETHRERSKLQDKLEFQFEDWNNELEEQTKKKLEEINAKLDSEDSSRDLVLQMRNVKSQFIELVAIQKDG
jgi:pyruvate-formate lyase